jgi:Tfp pilus assembly protein PilZ
MDVRCKMHFDTDVQLLNISMSGACLGLNKSLAMGSEYNMHIESGDTSISLNGVVIWERIAGSEKKQNGEVLPSYEVGIEFRDIFTEKGNDLVRFIEHNVSPKRSKVRLRGLRVKVIKPDMSTVVENHRSYQVLKISESGMLIETEKQFELENAFKMEIDLPKEKESIQFRGRVASSLIMPKTIPMRYGTGIEFLEISKNDRLRLKQFIETL